MLLFNAIQLKLHSAVIQSKSLVWIEILVFGKFHLKDCYKDIQFK